jgi:hypothetical protein
MSQVTGIAFVTIQNHHAQAVNIRQGFVPFQTLVDLMNPLPQSVGLEHGMDAPQGIRAEGWFPQPTAPKACWAQLFPGMDAGHAGPEQHQRRFDHGRGGDTWLASAIGDRCDDVSGEMKDLFRVGREPAEDLTFPSLEPLPLQLGNFFDQFLHPVIVVDGLANALLPGAGDANLAKLPVLTLHQVQGLMQLASGATAIRFAASAGTFRERAAEEPLAGGELGNPGTEVALGGREFGAVESVSHFLYLYNI